MDNSTIFVGLINLQAVLDGVYKLPAPEKMATSAKYRGSFRETAFIIGETRMVDTGLFYM